LREFEELRELGELGEFEELRELRELGEFEELRELGELIRSNLRIGRIEGI
jgi:hypothetical protein